MTSEVWAKRMARKGVRAVGIVTLIYILAKLVVTQIIFITESAVLNYSEEPSSRRCPRVKLFLDFNQPPKFALREKNFLLPSLGFGFLGQLRGLRESILLSIKLNRTLVLPSAISDKWSDFASEQDFSRGEETIVSLPGLVNLKQVSALISVLPSLERENECKKIDAVFSQKMNFCKEWFKNAIYFGEGENSEPKKGNRLERLRNLENLLQLPPSQFCLNEENPISTEIEFYPKEESSEQLADLQHFLADSTTNNTLSQKSFFPSPEATCAAFFFPNLSFDLGEALEHPSLGSLVAELVFHTQVPHHIVEIAAAFAEGAFFAVEWKFGEEEWSQNCKDLHTAEQKKVEWCKSLRLFRKDDNYHPIAEELLKLARARGSKANTVYIYQEDKSASTSDIENFLQSKGVRVLTVAALRSFLASSFPDCEMLFNSVRISQIELQLAIEADLLFAASSSLWSRTGELERRVRSRPSIANREIIEELEFN